MIITIELYHNDLLEKNKNKSLKDINVLDFKYNDRKIIFLASKIIYTDNLNNIKILKQR